MARRNSIKPQRKQQGVAILAITVLIMLIALIGTVMIGQVGMMEQKMVATDIRSKEVYSAAVGGLEYGVNWLQGTGSSGANYATVVWTDNDGDGLLEAGDTAAPAAMADTVLSTGTYGHTIGYELITDMNPIQYDTGDSDGDGVTDEIMNIRPVVIRVTSAAQPVSGDTHIQKTVSIDVVVGGEQVFTSDSATNIGEFEGPPIVVEGCVTGTLTGNPSINFDIDGDNAYYTDVAIASTTMYARDADNDGSPDYTEGVDADGNGIDDGVQDCIPRSNMEGHVSFCDIDQHPDGCPNNQDIDFGDAIDDATIDEFRMGLSEPDSLWNTVFGAETTMEDLLRMEALDPLNVIIVDTAGGYSSLHYGIQQTTYTGWNGNAWHDNLGSPDSPVVLYFGSAVDCPSINGSTVIYGLVYFEKEVCSNNGWGGGKVYGTVAKAGDMTDMNANAVIIASGLGFAHTGTFTGNVAGNYTARGINSVLAVMPGTWKDY